jgi:phosphoenolpyruvate---glycerone phosphotransferase subunit DhaL
MASSTSTEASLRMVIGYVAAEIRDNAGLLNQLDGASGDGDLGVTMSLAASAVTDTLGSATGLGKAELLRKCGTAIAREAPSTSGTLVATGFLRAAGASIGDETSAAELATRLTVAVDGIQERGGAEVGSKKMVDALVPAKEAAARVAAEGGSVAAVLAAAAEAADSGAAQTVDMQPKHGRAGWLAERAAGHEDAGARMIAIAFAAAARVTSEAPEL